MQEVWVYIDESGDEGIETGGSRWFILGGVAVPEEAVAQCRDAVANIRTAMKKDNKFVLRWKKFDHATKLFISQKYAECPMLFTAVVVDKADPRITESSALRQKFALYNYATRYLVERISWMARDSGRRAHLVFEHRSNLDYDSMWAYLMRLRRDPEARVATDFIDWETTTSSRRAKSAFYRSLTTAAGWYGTA